MNSIISRGAHARLKAPPDICNVCPNNITRYPMPTLQDELVCVYCYNAVADLSNVCNGLVCSSTGF